MESGPETKSKKKIWLYFLLGIIILIGIIFYLTNKTTKEEINISVDRVNGLLRPIGEENDRVNVKYTPSTEEHCSNGKCWKSLYSGVRFADDKGTKIENAKSLMNSKMILTIEQDKGFPIKIIDYNLSSITLDLQTDTKNLGKDIPIRIWKYNESYYDKCEEINLSLSDAKTISEIERCSVSKSNFKITYSNIETTTERFNSIADSKRKSYNFGEDYVLEYGFNSTTIKLQANETENLDDAHANGASGSESLNYGITTGLWVLFSTTNFTSYIKFNISSIPSGSSIDSSSLNLYITNNQLDINTEGYNISAYSVYNNYTLPIFDTYYINAGNPNDIVTNNTHFWITDTGTAEVYIYWINGTYTGSHFDTNIALNNNNIGITQNGTYIWIIDDIDSEVYIYWINGTYTNLSFDTNVAGNGNANGITQNGTYFWITDPGDDEVYKYWMNGTYISSFDTSGIANGIDGITNNNTYFWITDDTNDEVYIYWMNGTYTGSHFDTAESGCNNPNGITQNGTYFWIVDYGTDMVYRYFTNGTFDSIGTFGSWYEGTKNGATGSALAMTYARRPTTGYYNSTFSDSKLYNGTEDGINQGTPRLTWESFNVTSIVKNAYANEWKNVSIMLRAENKFGSPSLTDYVIYASKEYITDVAKRPYLNITYSEYVSPPSDLSINITPINNTYNATIGLVNFTCTIISPTNISNVTLIIDKYYGGWNLNNKNTFDSYFNTTFFDITGYSNKTNFNISNLINLSHGFYGIICSITYQNGTNTNSSESRYMTGKGTVSIIHSMHTEEDINTTNLAIYQNNLSTLRYEMADFNNTGDVSKMFNTTWRYQYNDSYGNPITISWNYRMDDLTCKSYQGCNAIVTIMETDFKENITFFNDGRGWHYHAMVWYNYSQWENDKNGVMRWNEVGSCPAGGCQPAQYWNQMVDFGENILANETSKQVAEKMLAQFIIGTDFYPSSYVSGWLWENNNWSNWADNILPFSYNAYPEIGERYDSTEPYEDVYNWVGASTEAYHPNSSDFRLKGNLSRIEMPCRDGYHYNYFNQAYNLANNGTDIIYCYYDHTYSGFYDINNNINSYSKCINQSKYGTCFDEASDPQTDMATLYPNVTTYYSNDTAEIQRMFGLTDTLPPTINLVVIGDLAYINSSETLWKAPLLAIKNDTNYYIEISVNNESNQWYVNISQYNPTSIRAVGIDTSFNSNFSNLLLPGVNIIYPTVINPITVTYPQNITINYTFVESGYYITTGVSTQNITIYNQTCTLQGSATYVGSVWTQNCTIPILPIGSFYILNITANTSTSGFLNDSESNAVYYTTTDTCTYGGSGNWLVQCSDNCVESSPLNLGGNDLILNGTGKFVVNTNIYNIRYLIKDRRCILQKGRDKVLA